MWQFEHDAVCPKETEAGHADHLHVFLISGYRYPFCAVSFLCVSDDAADRAKCSDCILRHTIHILHYRVINSHEKRIIIISSCEKIENMI